MKMEILIGEWQNTHVKLFFGIDFIQEHIESFVPDLGITYIGSLKG